MNLPRRLSFALLALAAVAVTASVAVAGPPALDGTNRDYEQTHLIVRVRPNIEKSTVDGRTTVRFSSRVEALKTLRLHCLETSVMSVARGDGAPLEFRLADGILAIDLGAPVAKGAAGEVTVTYRSRPTQGLYFHFPTKESPSTPLEMYSQGEGTDNRRWFPCYDEPDARCTCEVFATVPEDLKTVSNGVLVEHTPAEKGLRTDHWKLEQRIPSYLVTLIVGKFETITETWREVPVEYNGPVGRAAEIKAGYEFTPDMLSFFSDYTERKFPYPRYAQTTVWDFVYGGMENASATTMNMRLLHTPNARPNYSPDNLVAHELAHQWFGDLMTCRTWDHIWLNEGFATYFADLYFEHRDGKDQFSIDRWNQNRGYFAKAPHPESLGLTQNPRGDVPTELQQEGKQYDRGAAILHQLRIELGDEVFRKGIARYVRENEDRAVVTEDLRRSMEAESGQSLKWFFDQWVYGVGYPVLNVTYEQLLMDDGSKTPGVFVTVDQVQSAGGGQAEAFRMSIPIRLKYSVANGEAKVLTAVLDLRKRHQVFGFLEGPQLSGTDYLRVGDGGGLFAKVNLTLTPRQWQEALVGDPDPTGRMEAADALVAWPAAAAAPLSKALREDKVYAVRVAAAKALGQITGPGVLGDLALGLKDPDSRVRDAVAEALGNRTRDEASKPLEELVMNDPACYVRAQAARSLGKVHGDRAFDLLRSLLTVDSHRECIRTGALDGLAALGDRRAVSLAIPMLEYEWKRGDHFGMRVAALGLLTSLAPDEPETQAVIIRLLDDPHHRMRSTAAEAAGKFGVRAAKARLEAMAASDPDGGSKGAAKAALERLAKADK